MIDRFPYSNRLCNVNLTGTVVVSLSMFISVLSK